MGRLLNVPAPLTGDEGKLLVSFCIPNSRAWRMATRALISQFQYGRAYDEKTGIIKDALVIGREIVNSMSMCNLEDQLKVNRMLVAAILGEQVDLTDPANFIPDNVDYTITGPNPGLVPSLKAVQNLEVIGAIPGQGDTIQKTLWDIRDGITNGGITLDDWIAQMQAQEAIDPNNYSFKDWLEMLTFLKELAPNFGAAPLAWVMEQYRGLVYSRFMHTQNTIGAFQATSLRGIQNALAPFEEDEINDEESMVNDLWSRLDRIPWLTTAVVAIFDPSPTGETTLAAKFASAVKNIFDIAKLQWSNFINLYIDQVGTPQPTATVTGQLAVVAKAIEDLQTGNGNSNLVNVLGAIAANIANIKLSCSCGGSGCGGCSGGDPPADPGEEGGDPPPGYGEPPDLPGTPEYQDRKCQLSNLMWDGMDQAIAQFEETNLLTWISTKIESASNLITTIFLDVGFPFNVGITAIGFISNVLLTLIASVGVDLADLRTRLSNSRQDLVCALYNSQDASGAKSDFLQVLTDAGATLAQTTIVGVLFPTEAANMLYFTLSDPLGDEIEAELSSYVGTIDCGACDCVLSTLVGVIDQQVGNTYTISSEFGHAGSNPDSNWIHVILGGCCLRITALSLNGWTENTVNGLSNASQQECDGTYQALPLAENGGGGDPQAFINGSCLLSFNIISDTPFSITFTTVDDCP